MPTAWNERSAIDGGFQEGRRASDASDTDYFIDVLFEGSVLFGLTPTVYVERTGSAPAMTERVGVSTPWTERTI